MFRSEQHKDIGEHKVFGALDALLAPFSTNEIDKATLPTNDAWVTQN